MTRLPTLRTALALTTRRPVEGLRDGIHPARPAGESLDFIDLRDYVPGDDISRIDWRATARTGELLVRRHAAERQATLLVACATGLSWTGMANASEPKAEVAAAVAGVLGLLATLHQDRVGFVWQQGGPHASRPSVRAVELERMLDRLVDACDEAGSDGDLGAVLDLTATSLRRPGFVAVISDDVDFDAETAARLRRLSLRHEVMVVIVADLDPTTVVGRDVVPVEGGAALPAELLQDPQVAAELRAERDARERRRSEVLLGLGIRHARVDSVADAVPRVLDLAGRRA